MFMYYYTVCYFTGIFYAVVWQMSMLFTDNKNSVFCILPLVLSAVVGNTVTETVSTEPAAENN